MSGDADLAALLCAVLGATMKRPAVMGFYLLVEDAPATGTAVPHEWEYYASNLCRVQCKFRGEAG